MSQEWFYLRQGPERPSWNMAFDEALLEAVHLVGNPILRLYGWNEPAATFGYFQKWAEVASWIKLRPLIRRPTGGGLVPHDADWTYSLVFPPDHEWHALRAEESYRRAHEWISESLRRIKIVSGLAPSRVRAAPGQCFVGAEKFDVLAEGRKIAGAAQKRNKLGLLIQGSIQRGRGWKRTLWEEALFECARTLFAVKWIEFQSDPNLLQRAESLDREKYNTDAYNRRR